jgi:hypothetical protein
MAAIIRMEHNQILSLPIMSYLPTPGQVMNYCRSIRDRRKQRYRLTPPTVRQFEDWSKGDATSFIFTLTGSSQVSQDFLVDSIETIRSSNRPIMWAMRFESYWEKPLTHIDLIKVLVLQCLQINPAVLRTDPFPPTVAAFLDAADEKDWLSLLNRTAKGMPMLYVVLDADVLRNAVDNSRFAVARFLESLVRIVSSTSVKIVVDGTAIDRDYIRRSWDARQWSEARIEDGGGKRRPTAVYPTQRRTKRRRRW